MWLLLFLLFGLSENRKLFLNVCVFILIVVLWLYSLSVD